MSLSTLLATVPFLLSVLSGSPIWQAPVGGSLTVLAAFRPPSAPWASGHRGVDLAARPGVLVRAAGDGRVAFADGLAGRYVISIAHDAVVPGLGSGWRTTYEGVRPSVQPGQWVTRGQTIGTLAPTGSHCWCLHWGLKRGREYADPLLLLRAPVVLKPL